MASAGASGGELAVRIGLALVIVALVVGLYFVTVVPAREAAAAERETALTRQRMSDVRTALIAYRDSLDRYPSTLDSLVLFARTDSTFNARIEDEDERAAPLSLDSLMISPRSGEPFRYELIRDTTGVEIYWLADAVDGAFADSIGARYVDPALRNAASWE
jgi:type II secretory pathway pseudopilin PulG